MKLRKSSIVVVAVLTLAVALGACGTDPTATPVPTPTPSPTPVPMEATATPNPLEDPAFTERWAALIAAAQEEGEVVFLRSNSDPWAPVLEVFQNQFGVEVKDNTGGGRANTDRILAERSRGRYTVDVSNVGAGSLARLVNGEALMSIRPVESIIFHPDALDLSKWRFGEIPFTDPDEQYALAYDFNISQVTDIFYNTDTVTRAELDSIQSYRDLVKPEFAGRVIVQNPFASGSSGARMRAWQVLGPDFLEELVRFAHANDTLVDYGEQRAIDGLGRGTWDFAFGGTGYTDLQDVGLPIGNLMEERLLEGGNIGEIGGGTSKRGFFANAPNPNAAQLYFNWFFSGEGQTAFQTLYGSNTGDELERISMRLDVPQGRVTDEVWQLGAPGNELTEQRWNREAYEGLEESLAFGEQLYEELEVIF